MDFVGLVLIPLIKSLILIVALLTGFAYLTYYERKLVARFTVRYGPNRAGPFGLLQPIADAVKAIFKEEFVPNHVDKAIYVLAPALALAPALIVFAVIPVGPDLHLFGRTISLSVADVNVGLIYILAIASLGTYGVVLAGWSSNNKYSMLGTLRTSAQMISYELPMGIILVSVVLLSGSLSMVDLTSNGLGMVQSIMPAAAIFFLLLIGFAVKLPVFPLHTWLPDAHTDAPTAVSVMLAGALIKMGGYGMIRLCVSFFPDVARQYAQPLVILAIIGVLYGAAITLRQTDLKRLIAYSSISHMGYVLLGIFALGQVSMTGAALQMFSHGVVTGLLFAMAGLVIHNLEERDLRKLGGLARQVPVIAVVFSIAGLASLGLPTTSGFAAEFLIFIGSFTSTAFAGMQVYTLLAVLGVVVTAGYILWMLQQAFYGPVKEEFNRIKDADGLEKVYMAALIIVIMLVGIYPAVLTDVIKLGISPITGLLGG